MKRKAKKISSENSFTTGYEKGYESGYKTGYQKAKSEFNERLKKIKIYS